MTCDCYVLISRLFEQFDPVVDVTDRPLDWPGASRMQSPTSRGEISLQCGNTVCQFRVSCYKFIGEEEDSDDEDDKEDDNEEKEDEEDGGDPNKDEKAVDGKSLYVILITSDKGPAKKRTTSLQKDKVADPKVSFIELPLKCSGSSNKDTLKEDKPLNKGVPLLYTK